MNWILFLHILGATVWTGGHLVLAFGYLPKALRENRVDELQDFEGRFEKIGIPALITQVLTGLYMAFTLVPSHAELHNTENPISRAILLKLALLAVTFVLAVDARLRIIPKLSPQNLRPLAWHIIPVTIISILFVAVGVAFRAGGI